MHQNNDPDHTKFSFRVEDEVLESIKKGHRDTISKQKDDEINYKQLQVIKKFDFIILVKEKISEPCVPNVVIKDEELDLNSYRSSNLKDQIYFKINKKILYCFEHTKKNNIRIKKIKLILDNMRVYEIGDLFQSDISSSNSNPSNDS